MTEREHVFVHDFGRAPLDAETVKALEAVPKRKNGEPNRRYSAGKAADAWEREQIVRSVLMRDAYTPSPFKLEAFA